MKGFLPVAVMVAGAALVFPSVLPGQSGKAGGKAARVRKPAPAVADTFTVRTLQVRGSKALTAAQIQSVAALPFNQQLAKSDFDAARDRLLATGYFESVAFQYGTNEATGKGFAIFDVVEVPSVYPVQFENLPVPAGEIEAQLKARNVFYGPKVPGTQLVLGIYTRQIEQILAEKNHPERVIGELSPEGHDEFHILFRSAEPLPPVAFVTFTGNKAISSIALQNAMNDVAFGTAFSRDHFRQLLDHQIRPLYEAKGLVRVAFPLFTTEPAPKVKGVVVHVTVEEGLPYTLSKLSLAGTDADTLEPPKIKTGGVVNFDQLNEAMESARAQLKRNGYLDAQGEVIRKVDDKARTVEVTLKMTPGPQFHMGKLTIVGLDLNSEPVVRKMWITEEGRPFNAAYPDYFLKRIRDDGLFDGLGTTKSSIARDETALTVDVTLTFGASPKPKPPKRPGLGEQEPADTATKPGPPI